MYLSLFPWAMIAARVHVTKKNAWYVENAITHVRSRRLVYVWDASHFMSLGMICP